MNTHPAESNEYPQFLSYEIFDTERFTAWSAVSGIVCGVLAVGAALAAETPSEFAGKCTLSVLLFAGSMFAALNAEDRDVKKARVSGRNSVFNAYRQMFPEPADNQENKLRGLTI